MRNYWDAFLNSGWDSATTDPVDLRRVRTVTATAYLLFLLGVPYILRAYQWNIEIRMFSLPAAMFLMLMSILLLRRYRQLNLAAHLAPLALYIAGTGAVLTSGGINSIGVAWWLIVPLLAGLLVGLRPGVLWGVIVMLSYSLIYRLELEGFQFPDQAPEPHQRSEVLMQAWGAIAGVLIMMISYLSQLEFSERTLARQNQFLKQQIGRAEQAEEAAQRAAQAKTRFLANMSHELRTPLNSVLGFSQRLGKHASERLDSREAEAVSHIVQNGQRMLRLVDDLLDLSNIEAGSLSLSKSFMDLQQVLDRACRDTQPMAQQFGFVIKLNAGDEVLVYCDGKRIVQALSSVFLHCIRFADLDGIEVELGNLPQGALIQISYCGVPLSRQEQEQLFDRYNHLHSKSQREVDSSGLALPLAWELVSLHGGRLSLSQNDQSRVCFNLFLPAMG